MSADLLSVCCAACLAFMPFLARCQLLSFLRSFHGFIAAVCGVHSAFIPAGGRRVEALHKCASLVMLMQVLQEERKGCRGNCRTCCWQD